MNRENEFLTVGQTAVINGWLADYSPAESFDPETCVLSDTISIVNELGNMCNFDLNALSDYLASLGYRYHNISTDGIGGWILRLNSPAPAAN